MSLSISLSTIPALGTALHGGIFAGLTTRKDGSHCAVVLLPDQGHALTWKKAGNWAQKLEAELPSRPVWLCDEGDENPYRFTCHKILMPLSPYLSGEGERWYGPIPPDGDKP